MTILTVRFASVLSRGPDASKDIFFMGYWFAVPRVYTAANSTEVIEL